MTDKHF